MAPMRTYGDACKTAHALDLIGERWALLVVRELILGPKRFTDLRSGLPGASPDVLAQRLRELEAAGVVQRRKLDPPAGSWVYELTDWGRELEDIVIALGRWGSRSPLADEELLKSSVDATVLALKADFDQAAAKGLDATYALQLDGEPFRVRVADGAIEIARGRPKDPDAVIESEQEALAAVLWGQDSVTEGVRSGRVKLEGDRTTAKRFFSLFPLPTRVEIEAG